MTSHQQQATSSKPVFTAATSVIQSKQPSRATELPLKIAISRPPLSSSFVPGDIQSPTLKSDLEEAIKLANSSLASSSQSKASRGVDVTMLEAAFPNLLTNVPRNNGTSTNSYLGLDPYNNERQVTDLGFFPALFSNDPYMNSESFTNFGEHGDIGDKNPPPPPATNWGAPAPPTSQATLHRWINPPTTNAGASHDTSQVSHDIPEHNINPTSQKQSSKKNIWSKDPVRNGINSSLIRREPDEMSHTQHTTEGQQLPTTANAAALPRMPNSEPLILEKVFEAEGFVKVKSKRQKRSAEKAQTLSSPSISSARAIKQNVSRPKFTELYLDTASPSDTESGSTHSFTPYESSGHNGRDRATDKQSQSKPALLPYMSNGGSNHHEDIYSLSGGFDTQLNRAAVATVDLNIASREKSLVCLICYERFVNASKLLHHCQSAAHCSAIAMTIGGKKLINFSPPHPQAQAKDMKLCNQYVTNGYIICVGFSICLLF